MGSPNLQKFVDAITEEMFGERNSDAIDNKRCVYCHKSIIGFRDELSRDEYVISGLCQRCQDETFK